MLKADLNANSKFEFKEESLNLFFNDADLRPDLYNNKLHRHSSIFEPDTISSKQNGIDEINESLGEY